MNNIDLMNYWIKSSDRDYDVMLDLKEKNRNTYALFFGQLLIREIMDIVNKYAQVILAHYEVKAIILFGSYAKGTNHEDSDIDIAIITDDIKCNDVFDEQLNLKKLRRNIDYRIEPHLIEVADYDNVETPFVQEVIDTGIKVA